MKRLLLYALAVVACGTALGFQAPMADSSVLDFEEAGEEGVAPWTSESSSYGNTGRGLLQTYLVEWEGTANFLLVINDGQATCTSIQPLLGPTGAAFIVGCNAANQAAGSSAICILVDVFCTQLVAQGRRLAQTGAQFGITIVFKTQTPADKINTVVASLTNYVNGGLFANQVAAAGVPGTVYGVEFNNGDQNVCNRNDPSQKCPPINWNPNTDPAKPIPLPTTLLDFQVDSLVINTLPCGVYWQSSMPTGSTGPNAAVRTGMRFTVNTIAKEMGVPNEIDGGRNVMRRAAVLCTNPPKSARGANKQKKRLRVTIAPRVPPDQNGIFLNKLVEKVNAGVFKQNAANRGAGVWTPQPMKYTVGGWQAVCIPSVGATSCPTGGFLPSQTALL